eukprot:scaffold1171_cov234-Pinguiococcus_pyrenoidosus.AAC.2
MSEILQYIKTATAQKPPPCQDSRCLGCLGEALLLEVLQMKLAESLMLLQHLYRLELPLAKNAYDPLLGARSRRTSCGAGALCAGGRRGYIFAAVAIPLGNICRRLLLHDVRAGRGRISTPSLLHVG